MNTLWDDEHLLVDIKTQSAEFMMKSTGKRPHRIIIPSDKYPLSGEKRGIFVSDAATIIKDKNTIMVIDSVDYDPKNPCSNAINVTTALRKHSYDARLYTGWLFKNDLDKPTPYCWTVLDNSVIDLSNDSQCLIRTFMQKYQAADRHARTIKCLAPEVLKTVSGYPNHVRCYPLGVPERKSAYIGTECTIKDCFEEYNKLTLAKSLSEETVR